MAIVLSTSTVIAQQNPAYEFRGVWVATVENIDWPSKKGLSTDAQKAEFTRMLDKHQAMGLNAIVMQIRPVSDAFYPSQYEPWSEYLTGKQGQAPMPYYDPLQFMIEETHKRGMEFHAWINPYRAVFNINKSSVAANHVSRLYPQWFVTYGDKKYFDPGIPEARTHVSRVIKDVVERYDLDGIHFDDYFYPYRIAGKEFPDFGSYQKYGKGLSKDEWRRSNVDTIIKMLSETIKSANPRVKFGISPFGVWRNADKDLLGSKTRAGVTNYDDLYADILLWLRLGWIDYVAPQLYWEIGHKLCDYNTLLDWWSRNQFGRQLMIGLGVYRAAEAKSGPWKDCAELPNQVEALRRDGNVHGSIIFSSKSILGNPNGWSDSLRTNFYKNPALVPPMKWIDSVPPMKPLVENISKTEVRIYYRGAEPIKGFGVFSIPSGKKEIMENATLKKLIIANKTTDIKFSDVSAKETDLLYIVSVDRNNNVSDWVRIR